MLLGICALSALILILYLFALEYYLYWTVWWYDVMLHFLGGIIIGAVLVWILARFFPQSMSLRRMLTVVVMTALTIGLGWELFEYSAGMMGGGGNLIKDTIIDLCMDVLGSIAAYLIVYRITRKHFIK